MYERLLVKILGKAGHNGQTFKYFLSLQILFSLNKFEKVMPKASRLLIKADEYFHPSQYENIAVLLQSIHLYLL